MKEGIYIMLDVKDLYKESYIGKEITVVEGQISSCNGDTPFVRSCIGFYLIIDDIEKSSHCKRVAR